tara:strand:- start:226 stop:423 length:198 start_codon:yes stop_codon:yes gene_type:complete
MIEDALEQFEKETGAQYSPEDILRSCEECGCMAFLVTGNGKLQCVRCEKDDENTIVYFLGDTDLN